MSKVTFTVTLTVTDDKPFIPGDLLEGIETDILRHFGTDSDSLFGFEETSATVESVEISEPVSDHEKEGRPMSFPAGTDVKLTGEGWDSFGIRNQVVTVAQIGRDSASEFFLLPVGKLGIFYGEWSATKVED